MLEQLLEIESMDIISGAKLMDNLVPWLTTPGPFTTDGLPKHSADFGMLKLSEVELIRLAATKLYQLRLRYGGCGPVRSTALTLLSEVSATLQEKQSPLVSKALFNILADLAETVAKMSWHQGLESSAQKYFQIALRASYCGRDRLFAARVFSHLAWQMYHLGKPQDMLNLIHFAQYGLRDIAKPGIKAMLYMHEAWAYAALAHENNFQRSIELAQLALQDATQQEHPYWMEICDEAELAGMTGGGLRLLARSKPRLYAEKACELNAKAIKLRRDPIHSYTAQDYIGLAESRFLLKETELAVDAAEQAIKIYTQLNHLCGTTYRGLKDLYQYSKQPSQSIRLKALKSKLESLLHESL